MAQASKYENYSVEDLEKLATMNRPIAGQSLTNSPEQQYPWERPTKYNSVQPAIEAIFVELTEDQTYMAVMELVANDLPIGDIAQIILYDGFTKGMWNPDLLLLLIEPVMYMVLALAEQAGFPNPTLYRGEENEPSSMQEQSEGLEGAIQEVKEKVVPKLSKGVVPKDIKERVESFEPPAEVSSLLAKPKEQEEMPRESLLDRGAT
jgi:hypothetical protein|tara:strand:+ start:883 stop:1500 length:618 start_codon:yes stop_codon:yes gene_type:complete